MSGDLALTWDSLLGAADLSVTSGDYVTDDGLRTAVELSLFTDRRAEDTDVLPDGETDRRGWWADAVSEVEGDRMGSRLWLLARAKDTPDTFSRAEEYAREALAWMVADKVADRIDVTAERVTEPPALGLDVTIVRPTGRAVSFRFGQAWNAEGAR